MDYIAIAMITAGAFGLGVLARDVWPRITWDWLVQDDPFDRKQRKP